MPRVSIGMPVYNGERYVGEAVEGLLAQTFPDFELVIVDNASTDRTSDICRALAARDPRVRYHRNPTNIGGGPNFNRAFDLADRAPLFKWAAHDDRHAPDFLAELVAVLDRRPEVIVATCDIEHIDGDGKVFAQHDHELPAVGDERPSARFRNLIVVRHFCMDMFGVIRRDELAKTHRIASYVGSDRPMLAQLGLQGRFHRVPRVLFQMRDHDGRSIKQMPEHMRAQWFDPKLAGKISLPELRYLVEYGRSILRVPMPASERTACFQALAEWLVVNRRRINGDLKFLAGYLRHKIKPSAAAAA
jgi:glycosyltransferase involved in cell wall biosynthesis